MFPSDEILIARGKYSTLGRDRRKQLERVQMTCTVVMNLCGQAMKGAQQDEPDVTPINKMRECVENLEKAAEHIAGLNAEMSLLKEVAWS